MAKRKEEIVENNINQTLDNIISDRFGSYSKYIIQERALPDARDGLKPVQRRILYSMWVDGCTYDKPHRKSAKTVGSVMGTFHPHGDSSIYEAMVRMSQDWKINVPLIDMHGNNGSIDDDPPAAMRYTEARLSKNADLLLNDIDKQTVAMTNNYDDTCLEPTVLPARYPVLLVNGSTGIASGYATNIAPHNIDEVINATIYRLKNPDCSLDSLMNIIKGPDFPTGAIVQGKEQIKEIFRTGKGKVIVRSKCSIEESKTSSKIIVSEIPYEVIKCQLVKRISDIYLAKDIDGIVDVRDESDRTGLRIVIECKKDANCKQILNYLYKNTDLQINYSYNNVAIVNHKPVLMSLTDALDAFINHRREVVLNRTKYLKDKKESRLHIIDGLIKAISILDDVIALIRKSKDKKDAKDRLISAFLFTEEQAEAIVSLRLYRLTSTDVLTLKQEADELKKEINELKAILGSREVLDALITKELKEIIEVPTPRKTQIDDDVEEIVIDKMAMIANDISYISVSRDGYIKKFSERAFNANENQIPSVKDGDALLGVKQCEALDTLLLFTSKGNLAYLPIYKLDECKFKEVGKHVSSYVKMEGMEKIVGAIVIKNFDTFAFVVTVSKKGMIKKTSIPKMNLERLSKAITCMKLKANDELASVCLCYENDDLIVISKQGNCVKYSNKIITDIALKAQGVIGMSIKEDDEVVAVVNDRHNSNELLLASDRGGFKRIHCADIEYTSRNAKGNRLFKQVKSNQHNIIQAVMTGGYNSLYISCDNKLTELPVSDIPFMDVNSSFSIPLQLNNYFFIKKDMSDILEAEIVDIPADYYDSQDENTQTTLF